MMCGRIDSREAIDKNNYLVEDTLGTQLSMYG